MQLFIPYIPTPHSPTRLAIVMSYKKNGSSRHEGMPKFYTFSKVSLMEYEEIPDVNSEIENALSQRKNSCASYKLLTKILIA